MRKSIPMIVKIIIIVECMREPQEMQDKYKANLRNKENNKDYNKHH